MLLIHSAQAQSEQHFNFGVGKKHVGYTEVLASDQYSDAMGFGFESTEGLYAVDRGGKSVASDFISSNKPFYFSVKLPEGNYQVKILLGDTKGVSITTVRVECRRLMANHIVTEKGKLASVSFAVHVRDTINRATGKVVVIKPREKTNFHWDNKLTFEFNDSAAKIAAVDIIKDDKVPTVFLTGNSTVVDQPDEPWASWGQMIPSFFTPGTIAVANYAESGETLKAFENEGRLAKVWSMAKPGDYLFMEFAHNDQKPGPNHLDPYTTYQETLANWIALAKSKGMHPVFVTSTNRRTFDSTGHVYNSLGEYPNAMRDIAIKLQVPLINLNAMSKAFYEALGPTNSTKAFVYFKANAYPNQLKDVKDDTHFNTYGAYELAKCVARGIHDHIPSLSVHVLDHLKNFQPSMPDNPDTFHLPEGLYVATFKPDGN
jgi:lysophospholipase L1-like esterase